MEPEPLRRSKRAASKEAAIKIANIYAKRVKNSAEAQAVQQFIAVDNAVNNALEQIPDGENNTAETNVDNIDRQIAQNPQIPQHIQNLPFYTQELAIIGANMLALAGQGISQLDQLRNTISGIGIDINNPTISSYLNTLFEVTRQYAGQSATEVIRQLEHFERTAITIGRLLELAGVNQVLQAVGNAVVQFNLVEATGNNSDYGGSKQRKSKKSKKSKKSRKSRKSKRRRTHRRK